MAGKKQHHIPQSLQRGFLFDVKGERTYVHRRDGVTFAASIKDVAAQRYFYSHLSSDGSKTLDDLITHYESRLGDLLAKLRAVSIDDTVDAEVAAEVIAHLSPRSGSVRRIFGSGMKQLMTTAAEAFSDEDTFLQILGLADLEPGPIWNKHIAQALDKETQVKAYLESLPIPRTVIDRILFMAAKENFVGSFDAIHPGITKLFASLLGRLDDIVRDGHNKALGQGLVVDSRKISLEALEWHIRAAPPVGAILPDCVAIAVATGGGAFLPYMMTSAATVSAVVMPIMSQKLLVGVRPGHDAPDLSNFNPDAAACSAELFITASQTPILADLSTNMGQRWASEINSVVQTALNDLLPSKKLSHESDQEAPPLPPLSYQLIFSGLGNEEQIAPISEMTQRMVAQVGRLFNLERLEGIVYAADHKTTLTNLERGFDINTSPEGVPDYVAPGAAIAMVLREGIVKVRIVMHADYGRALVADHQQNAEVALHFLVAALAQVSTINQIERALPNFLLRPVMLTDHDGILHCAIRKAVRAYRYARDSAGFGADEFVEKEFSKYMIACFGQADTTFAKAKEEHAANPNFPKLFEVAHNAASDILVDTARLLGHRCGVGKVEFPSAESDVDAVLAAHGLINWVQLFSNDLQLFWQKGNLEQVDCYALNIHVERVLWANGIILWRDPSGQGTIIMPAAPHLQPPQLPA